MTSKLLKEHAAFSAVGFAAVADIFYPGENTVAILFVGGVGAYLIHASIKNEEKRTMISLPLLGFGAGYFVGRVGGYGPGNSIIFGGAAMAYMMLTYHNKNKYLTNPKEDTAKIPRHPTAGQGRHTNFSGFGGNIF